MVLSDGTVCFFYLVLSLEKKISVRYFNDDANEAV